MDAIEVAEALTALGVEADQAVALDGSRSGAGVHRVRIDDRDAVLKISRGDDPAARRELEVYRTLGDRLPVRTPTLITYAETATAVVLLLSAHDPPRLATDWTPAEWVRLADDLAQLHSTVLPDPGAWSVSDHPVEPLQTRDHDELLIFWSRPEERSALRHVLADTDALARAVTALPDAFVHGDCHPDNLLHHREGFVWVDWQSAGTANPVVDLAFPSVRITPAGVRVPYDLVLTRYAASRSLDRTLVERAVVAAELAIFVAVWPPFAGFNTAAGIDRVHDRVVELAREWLGWT